MNSVDEFNSVWDAIEDDPVKAENMKLRSSLMMAINECIQKKKLNQVEAAKLLGITQPRVSALAQGKIEDFRLDALVNFATRIGLHISIQIAA